MVGGRIIKEPFPVQIQLVDDYAALSRAGAELLASKIKAQPELKVILATGNSPMGMYRDLVAMYQQKPFDTSRLRVFQLDGYLGLDDDDHRSLYGWLARAFLTPLNVPAANVVRLPGNSPDPEAVCRAFDEAVEAAGGIDFTVLGIGPNGHLGFNEPPSAADAPTRIVDLTPESIKASAAYWDNNDEVPTRALTAGLGVLLAVKETLLLVSGSHKRDILNRALTGPITPDVPASFLQQTPNVTVLVDRDAWTDGVMGIG
jgi:glucosamine-6-phosphate deaminase